MSAHYVTPAHNLIELSACATDDGLWTLRTHAPKSIHIRIVYIASKARTHHSARTVVQIRDTLTNELYYDSTQTTTSTLWCRTRSVNVLWKAVQGETSDNDTQARDQVMIEYRFDG